MKIEKFEDIQAWQAARELTNAIYKVTAQGHFARDYGLRDQILRAAISIMANIAEGFGSQSTQTFIQFLGYALRSATEVQSHLYVAFDQGYIDQNLFDTVYQQTGEVRNLLYGFIRYLRSNKKSQT